MAPPYCTALQVRAICDTDITDPEITELIEETDAFMDFTMDTGSMPVFVLRLISRTMTAIRAMLKDPSARSLGDYEEDRAAALKKLNEELDWYIMGASGGGAFRYGYADLRWR